MLESSNNMAFKEWAIICRLLGAGRQSIIIRKGGIIEKGGEFTPEHDEFFLFPTFAHEQKMGIAESAREELMAVEQYAPPLGLIPISIYAKVTGTFWLSDEKNIPHLSPFHFWSEDALHKKFHYGKKPGFFILATRIYRLPHTRNLQNLDYYAGCKSWVELKENIETVGAAPVLDDSSFHETMRRLQQLFEVSPVA